MPTVRLSFTPAPAHVRTARLVGVAVARRAGVAPELFDEIRLAIGEACSRAVALHHDHSIPDLVEVALGDDERFTVRVIDRAPIDAALSQALNDPAELADPVALLEAPDEGATTAGASEAQAASEEAVTVGMRLALLAGLVENLTVRPADHGPGTEVLMSWPAASGRTGAGGRG
ncbi:ATP-binding protein [Rugosimonospora acidiphila]|uniref:ATP-binding protein n=1 Tax=Rugosimonospora acidiphila TaxID=556531 RepID=A0ABP9RIM3_9ACTN